MLAGGERIDYDALLLATGAEPRRPPIPGTDLDGVHVLRSLEDSDALRGVLDAGGRLVVVGAGWIGSEVSASARQRGMDVALVESQSVPLEGVLGPELGAFYRDVHADHGVQLHLGTGVEAIEGDGRAERVRTSDGTVLDCAAVLIAVGVAPADAAGRRRARRRQRDPRRRLAARERRRRLRGRRRRQPRPPAVRAAARRALGQRARAGAVGGARDARSGRRL